ncbi:uncharacterized protein BDR25DRAFT_387791 [Lindgomyces ingoldianus]|uniref:Uncharacterized protein n=1 Tax=Lindgomyces ingoldianus TaxID=673940 RepID=A0ACB6R2M3_9PLEO|nr:uncharacterized protein BDR25DRAFT_387791 [Lindgomyces ingoldianus]KAF2473499.1 hypothetical protein BDR25DRAFT_387791 [Lindgomyces ingoldianus]
MPFTLVLLVARKPGLSLSAFKHHWEAKHLPLLKSLVGLDFPLSHTRHYLDRDPELAMTPANILFGTQEDFNFDAIAVFTFIDRAHWERFWEKVSRKEAKQLLTEDDEKFQDKEKLKAVFIGDTKATGRDGGAVGWRFVGSV